MRGVGFFWRRFSRYLGFLIFDIERGPILLRFPA